jgi:hypothetical protein
MEVIHMKKIFAIVLVLTLLFSITGFVAASSGKTLNNEVETVEVEKPSLYLDVSVDNLDTASKGNVTYKAKLKLVPTAVSINEKPIMVDFYAGSPLLTVYPSKHLGSAPVDKNGVAVLEVLQRPGKYAGGAVCVVFNGKKLFSNVVYYEVPRPQKPILKLDVKVQKPQETAACRNVTYVAELLYPISAPDLGMDADNENGAQTSAQIVKPVKIDFYMGDPNTDAFPYKYIGSARIIDGKAKLTILQRPGMYTGGAVWARTPWGKIRSNIVTYKVPRLQIVKPAPQTQIINPASQLRTIKTNAPIKTSSWHE